MKEEEEGCIGHVASSAAKLDPDPLPALMLLFNLAQFLLRGCWQSELESPVGGECMWLGGRLVCDV